MEGDAVCLSMMMQERDSGGRWGRAVLVRDPRGWRSRLKRIAGWLSEYPLLFALVIFHLVNNWIYLSTRVTILGLDWPSHLRLTLAYNDVLQDVNIRTLFEAVTRTAYRPPLPWLPPLSQQA